MPWTDKDSLKHNSNADTEAKQKLWAKVANSTLQHTGDDAAAIRAANSVLRHMAEKQPAQAPAAPRRAAKSNLGTGMKPHWTH
jgi:hypothetical protein